MKQSITNNPETLSKKEHNDSFDLCSESILDVLSCDSLLKVRERIWGKFSSIVAKIDTKRYAQAALITAVLTISPSVVTDFDNASASQEWFIQSRSASDQEQSSKSFDSNRQTQQRQTWYQSSHQAYEFDEPKLKRVFDLLSRHDSINDINELPTDSIIDLLNALWINPTKENRAELYEILGLWNARDYERTFNQNIEMIGKMKSLLKSEVLDKNESDGETMIKRQWYLNTNY